MYFIKDGKVIEVNQLDLHSDKVAGLVRISDYNDEITKEQYDTLRKVVPDEVKERLVPIANTEEE